MEITTYNQLLKIDLENGAAITHLSLRNQNGNLRAIIEPNEEFKFESSLLFPFPFILYITYKLRYGTLDIDVKIKNNGSVNMPCGFGWHPYFNPETKISEAELRMNNMVKAEVNDHAIRTGKYTPYHIFDQKSGFEDAALDNCFKFSSNSQERSLYLVFEDKTVRDVWQDHQQDYVQIFIHPNKKAIAIEPMTCGIDAFNTGEGLRVLGPEEFWGFKLGLRYT